MTDMKKLLSLPPNLVACFHEIEGVSRDEWFCTSDPAGMKLGSGGGTSWLLEACRKEEAPERPFAEWVGAEKRILLHAGGQSRRLPGYAPSGKILTPIPVFRWAKGQKLKQNLLSLQLPLYLKIMEKAPDSLHTLVASGDVYVRASKPLQEIPEADVVCYGLWAGPELAKNHGVFVSSRHTPDKLDYMLQKPSVAELGKLVQTHLFLMDAGIWLLSDRATEWLRKRSETDGQWRYYDLYTDFGRALGEHPQVKDEELNRLSVAVLPLPGGEFYHYGTSRELISSTVAVQNLVNDQREIIHRSMKPHPAMFVQNAVVKIPLREENSDLWIENAWIGSRWKIAGRHLITGIPENDWDMVLPQGVCLDAVPFGEQEYVARCYGFEDAFKGSLDEEQTLFMGRPVGEWLARRNLCADEIEGSGDMQSARLFPVCKSAEELGKAFRWMTACPEEEEGRAVWTNRRRVSADEISACANLRRLAEQREAFRALNWPLLAKNYRKSVFYQLNLKDAAEEFAARGLPLPEPLPEQTPIMTRIGDHAFRAQWQRLKGEPCEEEEAKAFGLLREGLTAAVLSRRQRPRLDVYADQIVWARSPVRIDLAGGWTDTPPFCLNEGGNVVNVAIELNGQQPLQAYVKPCREYKIVLRSIDLGAMEEVRTYEELRDFAKVGSPFSIPKAALALAGFLPGYAQETYPSLEAQLKAFGSGMEVTLLSAVPAGSGLGTSSILASTVLAAISDFCGLAWDKNEICQRTLALEQLLTTGGGWQDQYGGVLRGAKLLQTRSGFDQCPSVRWLPDFLFTGSEYRECHLLYYTGITRTAKGILAEIVRGMFLNSTEHLGMLDEMKAHALDLFEAVQRGNFEEYGRLVGKTWEQNKRLDAGTNPEAIEQIIRCVRDCCIGYKLPGAGGGGFLYMVAKSPEAASRIKAALTAAPPNSCARFVEMTLSEKGLEVSRS